MQIPAGSTRQGSAERLTDGERIHPVARQGPARQLKSTPQTHARPICGQGLMAVGWSNETPGLRTLTAISPMAPLTFAFLNVFRSGHDPPADLFHMFTGVRELTLQKFGLNLHCLLKIGCVDQPSRVLERGLHILFCEG